MDPILKIPTLSKAISTCWLEAEDATRALIEDRYFDANEEFITFLFFGELRSALKKANGSQVFEGALLSDLRQEFPQMRNTGMLSGFSKGLVGSVTHHPKEKEAKTGGDLGLVIARPKIKLDAGMIQVDEHYRRGLLTQAKITQRDSKPGASVWGKLASDNQRKRVAEHIGFLALLLYEYADSARKDLVPFQWQLCQDRELNEVENWLKTGKFPSLQESIKVIKALSEAKIGTDDEKLIDEIVCPTVRESMEIRIGWRPGEGPPGPLPLHFFSSQDEPQRLQVRN